jgi:predicted dehydrogenase
VQGSFGYWVFEGTTVPPQCPSWNYRKEEGGGMIMDMLPHWRYVLDNIIGKVKAVSCVGATHIPERVDEQGKPYQCTADDAAYATFLLEENIIAVFNASWATRVRRDDLLTIQVDGTKGSAVAGLRECFIQHYGNTPRPVWDPDIDHPRDFFAEWARVPQQEPYENAFKVQWELFLKHVVKDDPFPWNLLEGAKGVQLAEKGMESWEKRCWIDLPELE